MRAVDIIIHKRDRLELTTEEIEFFIAGYTKGNIPDYQAAALAMAILLNGMTVRETTDLTMSMANSGKVLDLSNVVPLAVDKHSTGGVGDKTSLVVEPIVAACGVPVGKMSGRGLGFTGGTLDKLEAIPGYRTNLSTEEFIEQLRTIGVVLSGQSADLAPADGKLYALRDVTGTIDSAPLIASSIMSKKIAAGAQAIVLDVKVGLGAFMKNLEEARQLARLLVDIAQMAGRRAVALLTDMNQPLGEMVGNALEVREAIETLKNSGPVDFKEHCLLVSSYLLLLAGRVKNVEEGHKLALECLESGAGWEAFRRLVGAQGGELRVVDNPDLLPQASLQVEVESPQSGYLKCIDARLIGETAMRLGAGRMVKNDPVDHAVGIAVHCKVGDKVTTGQPLFTIFANQADHLAPTRYALLQAISWAEEPVSPLPLLYEVIQ